MGFREVNGERLVAVEAYSLDGDYLITRGIMSSGWQVRHIATDDVLVGYWYDLVDAVQGACADRQVRS